MVSVDMPIFLARAMAERALDTLWMPGTDREKRPIFSPLQIQSKDGWAVSSKTILSAVYWASPFKA